MSRTTQIPAGCPSTDLDPYADAFLADPFPRYRELRDLGPVVWLERYGVAALARHENVRAALNDHERFLSSQGQSMCEAFNERMPENMLNTDPPLHEQYRRPMAKQLTPSALEPDLEGFIAVANEMTDRIVDASSFDAVKELTSPYSVRIVADLVGLPEEGRDMLGPLGELAFNTMGPDNDRFQTGDEALQQLMDYTMTTALSGQLCPGSRGAELVEAGDVGALGAYTWPGIDTTVHALSAAIYRFAKHPDQWDLLRNDPSLANSAFNEVLRLHTPVQTFTRVAGEPIEIDGVTIAEGTRIAIMYGAANRDERRYDNPDQFDISRNARDQLAFGRGIHLCVGSHLARAEATTLFNALIERVERFELTAEPEWYINNVMHGISSLPVRAIPTR